MNEGNNQVKLISDAVKEQLGIEEDEDESLVFYEGLQSYESMNQEINNLKTSIKEKDIIIHKLELKLSSEAKRIDKLERLFFEFKDNYKR